jgi:hypothetical protein
MKLFNGSGWVIRKMLQIEKRQSRDLFPHGQPDVARMDEVAGQGQIAKIFPRRASFIANMHLKCKFARIYLTSIVCKWSQLMAQSRGMPSALERYTSDGMLRTVVVMGAMVTSPRYSNTESRVRIRTGLFFLVFGLWMRRGRHRKTIAALFGHLQVVTAFPVLGIQIQGVGQMDDGFLGFCPAAGRAAFTHMLFFRISSLRMTFLRSAMEAVSFVLNLSLSVFIFPFFLLYISC